MACTPLQLRKAKQYRLRLRAWLDGQKNKPCMDCHHRFPPECMDFHHVRGKKLFNIGTAAIRHGYPATEREIAKCELICANCHRTRTKKGRTGWAAAKSDGSRLSSKMKRASK